MLKFFFFSAALVIFVLTLIFVDLDFTIALVKDTALVVFFVLIAFSFVNVVEHVAAFSFAEQ